MAFDSLLRGALNLGCLALLYALSAAAAAIDYRATASGKWNDPNIWSPNGVPKLGDRVLGLGAHDVTVTGGQEIGTGIEEVAISIDNTGRLIIASQAQLVVHGHLNHSGWRGEVLIRAAAKLLFAPAAQQIFEFRQNNQGQRVTFAGAPNARAEIGLAPGAQGHYFFSSPGFRDSRVNGSYGRVVDAFDPVSEQGWLAYMDNVAGESLVEAHHIEFLRCGSIEFHGFDAGRNTRVALDALTFRQQAKSGAVHQRPAFWFDGYLDQNVELPPPDHQNYVTNIVSDTPINLRFVANYVLDDYVLDGPGAGNTRIGNNSGNALSHNNVFMAIRTGGQATNLLANTTTNSYLYAEANNPHGWATQQLRGDAVLTNYWFESNFAGQSDNGDAVLTNGPQSFVHRFGGPVPTLTLEQSGSIGDGSSDPRHPVLFSFNNSDGIRLIARNNVARVGRSAQAIAVDENGITPTGAGIEFNDSIVFSDTPNSGQAIGSAASSHAQRADTFLQIDRNLYHNLRTDGPDGALGVHGGVFTIPIDGQSIIAPPELFDPTRNLASWDASLGGPGTAEHAIEELKKRNDDAGFNANYNVTALTRYVSAGYTSTNPLATGNGPSMVPPGTSAPIIVTEPENAMVDDGSTASFSVVATGNPAPDYQWRFEGVALANETNPTLTIAESLSSAGNYDVVVSNSDGSVVSRAAALVVTGVSANPTIALIVDQPDELRSGDSAIRDQLIGMGLDVKVYDDDGITQSATQGSDAVLVSRSVRAALIRDTFASDPRPVMTWEHFLFDDMKLTGRIRERDYDFVGGESNIRLIDTSTGIGASLDTGNIMVTDRGRRVSWGVPGSDSKVIATLTDNPERATLFVYEAGSELADSSIAAGKRVAWYESLTSATRRTTSGTLLFEQSIDWLLR